MGKKVIILVLLLGVAMTITTLYLREKTAQEFTPVTTQDRQQLSAIKII